MLPLVPPQGIAAPKASEAVRVLVSLLSREHEGLAVSTARAAVKCLGALVGFCDLEDWGSVEHGFETLLKFSVDKRPKLCDFRFPWKLLLTSFCVCLWLWLKPIKILTP